MSLSIKMNTEIDVQHYLELYLRNYSHGCHFEYASQLEWETNIEEWLIRTKADSRYLDQAKLAFADVMLQNYVALCSSVFIKSLITAPNMNPCVSYCFTLKQWPFTVKHTQSLTTLCIVNCRHGNMVNISTVPSGCVGFPCGWLVV